MQEEVIVTAQLTYSCDAENAKAAQSDKIHTDMIRLLDEDSTTGVACVGLTIQHVSTEAMTYGNAEARKLAERQSGRIFEALCALYGEDNPADLLTYALSDLRHFADQHSFSHARYDRDAFQIYRAERDTDDAGTSS